MEPFVVIASSGKVQGTISFPELMRMQRQARKLVLAALRGDPLARQSLESLVEQYRRGDVLSSVSRYLVYEAYLDEQEKAQELVVPAEKVEVRHEPAPAANTNGTACKAEHPPDIPCEECVGTFVRPAKRPRAEARV